MLSRSNSFVVAGIEVVGTKKKIVGFFNHKKKKEK
jgi:hypothetical protein